jgi:hypothetical protein
MLKRQSLNKLQNTIYLKIKIFNIKLTFESLKFK